MSHGSGRIGWVRGGVTRKVQAIILVSSVRVRRSADAGICKYMHAHARGPLHISFVCSVPAESEENVTSHVTVTATHQH